MTTDGHNDESGRAPEPDFDPVRRTSNSRVVLVCISALLFMGAAAWAAVPLYQLFCQVTGFGGTPMRADQVPNQVFDRVITVRFDSNVAPGLPWGFEPVQRTLDVKVGENMLGFYKAHNASDKPITGTATFNVSPYAAGPYFAKIDCFCFTEQTLQPGESVEMPVSFFVDPSIMDDREADRIREITLSYTFYPMTGGPQAEVQTTKEPKQGG